VLSPDAFLTTAPGPTKKRRDDLRQHDRWPPHRRRRPLHLPTPPPPIPAPWQQQDIGAVGMPGYGEFDGDATVFTIAGAGADVWGTADALHYAYTPLNGDGTIVARVTAVQNTNVWVKAGVMIRETVAPGAAQAFMLISAAKGTAFQRRQVANGASVQHDGLPTSPRRTGCGSIGRATRSRRISRSTARPGGFVGTDTIAMAANVLMGLAVSSTRPMPCR
jgi:hypothetical protein